MKLFRQFGSVSLLYSNQARNQLLSGVKQLQHAASITLGPQGRNVLIEAEMGNHRITKDGVTVVKSIFLKKRIEEMGAALIRQSSSQTNKFAGDGTTTSAIIASSIFELGQKYVDNGHNPIQVVRGIKEAFKHILEYLEEIKTIVEDDQLLFSVAKLSSNYDEIISKCVYEAIKEVGVNGQVIIEPGSKETLIKIQSGFSLNRGLMHQQFADSGKTNLTLSYPFILTTLQPLNSMKQLIPILELIKQTNQPLFIIAPDMSEEVMSQLLFNHLKDIIRVGAITVPGFGSFSEEIIRDFAAICGSTLIEGDMSINSLSQLGQVVKVEVKSDETIVSGTNGDEDAIELRKEQINNQMSKAASQVLKDRLARFNGKSAILYVGGGSEVEVHENRDKMVDSLNSTKNTLIHGILPGGGSALLHASKLLEFVQLDNRTSQLGVDLLKQVLREPIKILCENAELNGAQVIKYLLEESDYNVGFDVRRQCLGNMLDMGVVDSYQAVKQSLLDGVGLGSMLLSTDVAIVQNLNYTPTSLKNYKKEMF